MPPVTMLGIEHTEADLLKVKKTGTVHDYEFTILPINRYHSRAAEQTFVKFAGSMNPKFETMKFDSMRERMQTVPKAEKEKLMRAFAILYTEGLAAAFIAEEKGKLDLAKFEQLLYPKSLMTHADTLKAVGMRRKPWWTPILAAHLENYSRLPLERCSQKMTEGPNPVTTSSAVLSFAEFYSLFWNHYHPFNTLSYLCLITRQTTMVTQEFIDGFADLLLYRHSLLDKEGKEAPILFLGGKIGKIGALLNATKKLPVTVIHTHENPIQNPYLMFIPPDKQAEFRPNPIIKMKNVDALAKYEPRIVLLTDMEMNVDDTQLVRQQGSVREYYYIGFGDSYIEGRPYETWARRNDEAKTMLEYIKVATLPPLVQQGWIKRPLPHLSRWLLHRYDSQLLFGCAQLTGFYRRSCAPTAREIWGYRLARLRPFF